MIGSERRPSMRLRHLQALRPRDARELRRLIERLWGLRVVDRVVNAGSTPPLSYLAHAFFEEHHDNKHGDASRDAVVWANRGGGKTMLGAVATLLDLIFKPGIEVRVLGGSLEQSEKMYGHLRRLLELEAVRGVLATEPTARRVILDNGSRVEVLAGSQRSVRGVRVHKLRCDEAEELDPAVWEAAQLTTRSGLCGDVMVRGAVEALSTMHRSGGLMSRLVGKRDGATREQQEHPEHQEHGGSTRGVDERGDAAPPRSPAARVFRWNAIDVAARCPPALPCDGCALWEGCGGRAKHADGFIPVDDLIQQWRRSSRLTWDAEMLCARPGVAHAVFPSFDPARHVRTLDHKSIEKHASTTGRADAVTPTSHGGWVRSREDSPFVAGMDFGLRCPTVMLWGWVQGRGDASVLHILAEYDATDRTLPSNLDAIEALRRQLGLPPADALRWLAIDPAGNARNAHTGRSDAALLTDRGYRVRHRAAGIEAGVEAVRRRLDHDRLRVHPRCTKLITALQSYHFDPDRPHTRTPVKDGPDHWCDALRYLVMQLDRPRRTEAGRYTPA